MLLACALVLSWHAASPPALGTSAVMMRRAPLLTMQENPPPEVADSAEPEVAAEPQVATSSKFDLKAQRKEEATKGVGFNQFDPVLTVTTFVSRRFGLAGGLGLVALLAATEGNEILKSILDTGPKEIINGETITTPSGLKYVDKLVGSSGE